MARMFSLKDCPNCRKKIPDDALACPYCGASFSSSPTVVPRPPPPIAQPVSRPQLTPHEQRKAALIVVGLVAVAGFVGYALTHQSDSDAADLREAPVPSYSEPAPSPGVAVETDLRNPGPEWVSLTAHIFPGAVVYLSSMAGVKPIFTVLDPVAGDGMMTVQYPNGSIESKTRMLNEDGAARGVLFVRKADFEAWNRGH